MEFFFGWGLPVLVISVWLTTQALWWFVNNKKLNIKTEDDNK